MTHNSEGEREPPSEDPWLSIPDLHNNLVGDELVWAGLLPFLKSKGYLLRKRYQPSWKESLPKETDFKDETYRGTYDEAIDAFKISEKKTVVLKLLKSEGEEYRIHSTICLLPQAKDHFIPIHDAILLPDTDEQFLMVLPFLQTFDPPRLCFDNIYEALECCLRLVENLAILHQHMIAHNDILPRNLGMLPTKMFFKGWHFVDHHKYAIRNPFLFRTKLKDAPYIPRCLAHPLNLFFDFGLSVHIQGTQLPVAFGPYGTLEPPEMTRPITRIYYFPVDVWCLGNTIQLILKEREYGDKLAILVPWLQRMQDPEPKNRPTAGEAVAELRKIIESLSDDDLRQPLVPKYYWSLGEKWHAVLALLSGEGDERVLFPRLRGIEPKHDLLPFWKRSFREKKLLMKQIFRFWMDIDDHRGSILQLLSPVSQGKMTSKASP